MPFPAEEYIHHAPSASTTSGAQQSVPTAASPVKTVPAEVQERRSADTSAWKAGPSLAGPVPYATKPSEVDSRYGSAK